MAESIEIYSKEGKFLSIKDKDESHKEMIREYKKKGTVSTKHKHVKAILLTSEGKLILQKRSKWKGDNFGLWDKTIGGHPFAEESFDFAIVRECAEELQIPTVVAKQKNFIRSLKLIDLNVMGVLFKLKINKNDSSKRKIEDDKFWHHPLITAYYIGYYDGAIRFERGESSGFRISTISEIKDEIKKNPQLFTHDLIKMLDEMKDYIKPLKELK